MTPHPEDAGQSPVAEPKPKFRAQPLSPEDEEIAKLVEKPNLKFGGGRFPDGVTISNPEDLEW